MKKQTWNCVLAFEAQISLHLIGFNGDNNVSDFIAAEEKSPLRGFTSVGEVLWQIRVVANASNSILERGKMCKIKEKRKEFRWRFLDVYIIIRIKIVWKWRQVYWPLKWISKSFANCYLRKETDFYPLLARRNRTSIFIGRILVFWSVLRLDSNPVNRDNDITTGIIGYRI